MPNFSLPSLKEPTSVKVSGINGRFIEMVGGAYCKCVLEAKTKLSHFNFLSHYRKNFKTTLTFSFLRYDK